MQVPFESVVEQHGATVLRVCRALLGAHDADDAWSETFLAALRAYPQLPDGANVEAWLVTIARCKAIDVHRGAARRAVPLQQFPEAPSALGVPGEGDDELWQLVAKLPDKQRRTIAFRYLGGLSYAQIAAVLGGSEDAARRANADGLKALRRKHPAMDSVTDSTTDQTTQEDQR